MYSDFYHLFYVFVADDRLDLIVRVVDDQLLDWLMRHFRRLHVVCF